MDNAKPTSIAVELIEHRLQSDKTEAQENLANFTIDPARSRSINETLTLRGLPRLSLCIVYTADIGGITVMLVQSGRPLWTVSVPRPASVFSTVQLSGEVAISVLIHQHTAPEPTTP